MIRFTRVGKRFGATAALEDIDWEVEAGERVTVLGHSGAGKTTLLRLLAMELTPTVGSVEVGSFRSGQLNASRRNVLRRTLGIVFEDIRLLPDRSIRDNLALILQINGVWDRKQIDEKVGEVLEAVGAGECMRLPPSQLSAGERQRVAVARALIREPLLLIADEPTGNLDPPAAELVLGAIMAANERGATVVLSTNDEAQCERFGGRILRLAQGRIPPS